MAQTSSELIVTLPPEVALHARPAGVFVKTAMRYSARISVVADGREADAKSILKVLALGAGGGSPLLLRAEGVDAEAALSALADCVTNLSD